MDKRSPAPWIMLAAGIVLFVVGGVWGTARLISDVGELLPQETWRSGEPRTVTLEAGTWAVYELAEDGGSAAAATVDPASIAVTGPDGQALATNCLSCGSNSQSTTVGTQLYFGVVEFTADSAGGYTITSDSTGNRLAVGKTLTAAIGPLAGAVLLAVGVSLLGFFLGLAAVIWLIARAVSGRKTSVPAGAGPPAAVGTAEATAAAPRGWYSDSADPQQLRWWDGSQWTEHVKPRDDRPGV